MNINDARKGQRAAGVLYVAGSQIGGGVRVLMELMLRLDPARFVPSVVVPSAGAVSDWARAHGIPIYYCEDGDWGSRSGLVRRTVQFAGILARHRPALVHADGPMCYRALGLAARLFNASRICHLGFPPEPGEFERSFLSGPDGVIGCYRGQAAEHEQAIRRINPQCRVIGIPNGVDVGHFTPAADESPGRWRFGARHVVAILGHISEVKGYREFVQAAALISKALPDCAFLAVGGETTQLGFQGQVVEQVSRLGLTDRFYFLGFQQDVAPILRAADVMALPSLAEGLPLAVLEAMACGRPVVATPVGGVAEAIDDGKTGLLVPPRNPEALADAILGLLRNPARARTVGAAARQRVVERFSSTQFAERIQQFYDEILGRR